MTNKYLQNKNVLFFGPPTFNYHNEITAHLREMGANVTYYSDKPFNTLPLIATLRLMPKLIWPFADRFYSKLLEKNALNNYDIVLVIKGEGVSPKLLSLIKNKYKKATFILYLWDSILNVKNIKEKFSYFDKIYSFDPEDCKNIEILNYRPLFFLDKYYNPEPSGGDGVFFLGTLNGDRAAVLSKLSKSLNKQSIDFWLFIRSKAEFYLNSRFNPYLRNQQVINLLKAPMNINEINVRLRKCAAVLDIEHPKQKGLTMRTFEVLASGKKLVTTNKSIINHDFFDPSVIAVIDRNNPVISEDFLGLTQNSVRDSFKDKYALNGWLKEVLMLNNQI